MNKGIFNLEERRLYYFTNAKYLSHSRIEILPIQRSWNIKYYISSVIATTKI